MTPLPDFTSVRVLVAGDLMLDLYLHGSTSRISPEAPVPVVLVNQRETRVGGAGNVAVNVASLGASVTLLSSAGDDPESLSLEELLRLHGVTSRVRRVAGTRTITKTRVLSRHQQVLRLDVETIAPDKDAAIDPREFSAAASLAGAVVLSDYGKGALARVADLIAAARRLAIPVVVDPKGADFDRYRGATILTPNLSEFEAVAGKCLDDGDLVLRGGRLRDSLGLEGLLVTRGERGMTLLQRARDPVHLPAQAREVFDVTGAGDTVAAVVSLGLARGLSLVESVRLANAAAGIVVGKLGTATVTREELEHATSGDPFLSCGRKVHSVPSLMRLRERARAKGLKVVFTNGCFDVLHPGHVDLLERARILGDMLIVAVNDDDSVRRLKGDAPGTRRPVNSLGSRLRMLSALECVDHLVAFGDDTPEALIATLLPDVLVKGGDYRPEDIAGGRQVLAAGGEVLTLPLVPGFSTTGLIELIRGGATS